MLHLKKFPALVAALIMLSSTSISGIAQPGIGAAATATLTAKHGEVFKRDFVDWNREVWGEPAAANVSDQLHEGMQIGTGTDSWAEVTWPNVKTRAWANTVFAVAPNKRLVYLTGGEMLFRLDKNRKDKDPYFIWTKVLQARIRGTTVLVQHKGNRSRLSVLEGKVDVYNRLDHSTVTLLPGAVIEFKGYEKPAQPLPSVNGSPLPKDSKGGSAKEPYRPQPLKMQKFDGITDITYDSNNFVPIFQDNKASTNAFAGNKEALLNHPLINAGGKIDSIDLIQTALADTPGYSSLLPFKTADTVKLNRVVANSVEVKALPSNVSYCAGTSVGRSIKVPQAAFAELPPIGVILDTKPVQQAKAVSSVPSAIMPPPPMMFKGPIEGIPAQQVDADGRATNVLNIYAREAVFQDFQEEPPLPVQFFDNTPSADKVNTISNAPTLVPPMCIGPASQPTMTGNPAFQPAASVIPFNNLSAIGAFSSINTITPTNTTNLKPQQLNSNSSNLLNNINSVNLNR